MAKIATEASDQVLNFVKASGLDFKIVETPFSLEIKIKKKFIKYNLGSQPKTSLSKAEKDVKPNSHINTKPFSNFSHTKSITATNNLMDIMAKPLDSCTSLPVPFLTSHYETSMTSLPFTTNLISTLENTSSNATPMAQSTLFKVPKTEQAMNTKKPSKSFQNIESFNFSTIQLLLTLLNPVSEISGLSWGWGYLTTPM